MIGATISIVAVGIQYPNALGLTDGGLMTLRLSDLPSELCVCSPWVECYCMEVAS